MKNRIYLSRDLGEKLEYKAPVTQNLYHFGKIENPTDKINYKLETDSKISNYVRVQFSANSEYVDFVINEEKGQKVNGIFKEAIIKRERGITFIRVKRSQEKEYLYLTIFLKSNSYNKKLNNYVFKYMNALNPESFYELKIMNNNPKLSVQNLDGAIKVTFSPINVEKCLGGLDTNVLYNVKIVPKETYIQKERSDLIAITESPSIAKQFKHTNCFIINIIYK